MGWACLPHSAHRELGPHGFQGTRDHEDFWGVLQPMWGGMQTSRDPQEQEALFPVTPDPGGRQVSPMCSPGPLRAWPERVSMNPQGSPCHGLWASGTSLLLVGLGTSIEVSMANTSDLRWGKQWTTCSGGPRHCPHVQLPQNPSCSGELTVLPGSPRQDEAPDIPKSPGPGTGKG